MWVWMYCGMVSTVARSVIGALFIYSKLSCVFTDTIYICSHLAYVSLILWTILTIHEFLLFFLEHGTEFVVNKAFGCSTCRSPLVQSFWTIWNPMFLPFSHKLCSCMDVYFTCASGPWPLLLCAVVIRENHFLFVLLFWRFTWNMQSFCYKFLPSVKVIRPVSSYSALIYMLSVFHFLHMAALFRSFFHFRSGILLPVWIPDWKRKVKGGKRSDLMSS